GTESTEGTGSTKSTEPADNIEVGSKEPPIILTPIENDRRVEAALQKLSLLRAKKVIFLGQGKGAAVAINALTSKALMVDGLILINMADGDTNYQVSEINIPILDIYGSSSFTQIPTAVQKRKAIMLRNNKHNYDTRHITTVDYHFRDASNALVARVHSWLEKQFVNN
ncbi:MAG TPA: hypothetical protein DCS49_01290, partial [Gammaproteobacteria bacterium]|nr:hypothetical protein [Gammaproteobacteria bacterium]